MSGHELSTFIQIIANEDEGSIEKLNRTIPNYHVDHANFNSIKNIQNTQKSKIFLVRDVTNQNIYIEKHISLTKENAADFYK